MPQGARRRAAVYIRVSEVGVRDRQSPSYQTEDVQEERCRAMAAARGADVAGVYRDIDTTGRTWNRRGLNEVMALAEARSIDLVIVFYVSRLGRNLLGTLETVRVLQGYDVGLVSVSEGFDLSTSMGVLVFQMLASFAEYESNQRGEMWAISQARARQRGVWVGRIPFGYAKAADGTLIADPVCSPVIVEMFRQRAEGASIKAIARLIDAVKPLGSGLPRSGARTSEIIKNTKYRGTHEPHIPRLVTDVQWYAAQLPDGAPKKRSSTHDFFLTGIARCGTCGGSMAGNAFSGQDKATAVYTCTQRSNRGTGACSAGATIVAKRLEPWVLHHVRSAGGLKVNPDEYGAVSALDADVDELQRELGRYLNDATARSIVGETLWHEGLLGRREALEEARETAAGAHNTLAAAQAFVSWEDVEANPDKLRAFLRSRIVSLVVNPGRGKTVDQRCVLELLR